MDIFTSFQHIYNCYSEDVWPDSKDSANNNMTFASELIPFGKIVILSIFISFKLIRSDESKQLTLQGFLPLTGSGWTGGGACLPAVLMALRHVNERQGLLDGYNLTYSWVDTQVSFFIIAPESPY